LEIYMRKPLIVTSLFGAAIFTVGVVAGQIVGLPLSSAASKPSGQNNVATAPRPYAAHPGFSLGPRADGTVTAVSGTTVTVKADGNRGPSPANEYDNITTITLTASTKYQSGFGQTGSAKSIKVGSFIIAEGTLSSDGKTLTATKVMVGGGHGPGGPGPFGGPPPGFH